MNLTPAEQAEFEEVLTTQFPEGQKMPNLLVEKARNIWAEQGRKLGREEGRDESLRSVIQASKSISSHPRP